MASPRASRRPAKTTNEKNSMSLSNEAFINRKRQNRDIISAGFRFLSALCSTSLLCVLASISSYANQLALSPIYGSIPSYLYYEKGIFFSALLGWLVSSVAPYLPSPIPRRTRERFRSASRRKGAPRKSARQQNDYQVLLPIVSTMTLGIQDYWSKQSNILGAKWGPVITQSCTTFPLVMLSFAAMQTTISRLRKTEGMLQERPFYGMAIEGIGFFAFFCVFRKIDGAIAAFAWDYQLIGRYMLFNRLPLQIITSFAYITSLLLTKRAFFFILWSALIYNILHNVHIPSPIATTRLNSTLIPSQQFIIHDRVESLTGYLSVITDIKQAFKAMRCDHSLLGGQWVLPSIQAKKIWPVNASKPIIVGEPIYPVFAMLEAVRLVKRESLGRSTVQKKPKPDHHSSALVIGLGIGTTPTALAAHGVRTTVVEIDPAVDILARRHFDLPDQVESVIEDAADFVESAVGRGHKYDYIVHDVFTGGAEPVELFTTEFFYRLRSLLEEEGVIAINYVGDMSQPSMGIVVRTVISVFTNCRIFREDEAAPDPVTGEDLANLVIFCNPSASSKLKFRAPRNSDYLGTESREEYLMPKHEVHLSDLKPRENAKEKLSTAPDDDETNSSSRDMQQLAQSQTSNALKHWEFMREVVPVGVWTSW